MNLLLDTHALLWWLTDDERLSDEARMAIGDVDRLVFVSSASAWEIAIKKALGKLDAPDDLEEAISKSGFLELSITMAHARAAGELHSHHDDPFDRMLVAQAMLHDLTLVTRDKFIASYQVPTIWA